MLLYMICSIMLDHYLVLVDNFFYKPVSTSSRMGVISRVRNDRS